MNKQKRFEIDDSAIDNNLPLLEKHGDTNTNADLSAKSEFGVTPFESSDLGEPSTADLSLDGEKIGTLIAEQMDHHKYHPVVIFGSSNSGKSSLLCSLFSYFQIEHTKGIGIYLGDPFLPADSHHGRWAHEEAESFFYKGVQDFLSGTAQGATKSTRPFFIPVRIVPPNGQPEVRLAFMESNGEWYKPKKDTGRYFPELKAEINSVLTHFQRGISFIHIAPFTQVDVWSPKQDDIEINREEINDADLALVGAMNSYESIRAFKKNDSHMFLMTKWDAWGKQDSEGILERRLFDVHLNVLESEIKKLYLRGFTSFNNLKLAAWQKSQMQYCSGIIRERKVIKPNAEMRDILNMYPQTLWNWLYSNATRCNPDIGIEIELIPKPKIRRKGLIAHVHDFIERIVS